MPTWVSRKTLLIGLCLVGVGLLWGCNALDVAPDSDPDTIVISDAEVVNDTPESHPEYGHPLPPEDPGSMSSETETLSAEVLEDLAQNQGLTVQGPLPHYVGLGVYRSHAPGQVFEIQDEYETTATVYPGYLFLYVQIQTGQYYRLSVYIPPNTNVRVRIAEFLPYGIPQRLISYHYAYTSGWNYLGYATHDVHAVLNGFDIVVAEEENYYLVDDILYSTNDVTLTQDNNYIYVTDIDGFSTQGHYRINKTWPNAEIRYFFSNELGAWTASQKQLVYDSIRIWEEGTGVNFIESNSSNRNSKLKFMQKPDGSAGWSTTGKDNKSKIMLRHDVINSWSREAAIGTITHEIGHTLGLKHEHQRSDRDSYINVFSTSKNYKRLSSSKYRTYGAYNFESVMHYDNSSLQRKNPLGGVIGSNLPNKDDFAVIRAIYGTSPPSASPNEQGGQMKGMNNRCLDVYGSQREPGTNVVIANCNGGANQKWWIDGSSRVRGFYGRCLAAGKTGHGSNVMMATCTEGNNQKWRFDSQRRLVSIGNGNLCLDVYANNQSHGANVVLANCHGGNNQKWDLANTTGGRLQGFLGRCLDVYGNDQSNGANIVIANCHGGDNQRWWFDSSGRLRGLNGRCVDVYGAQTHNGANIVIANCHGGANQRWQFDGSGRLVGFNGRCLDVYGAQTHNGANIVIADCHGGANQKWQFIQ